MDRADVRLSAQHPPVASPDTATSGRVADGEETLWRAFAEARTAEAFSGGWLALQCRMIPGTTSGVVVLGPPDTGPYAPAAFWPEGRRSARQLAAVAEKAVTERRGMVVPRPPRPDSDAAARPRYDVAYPIQVDGKLYGVVAVEVSPRTERDLQHVLRHLQWGAAWLEVLMLRDAAAGAFAVRERLQTVFDLVATALGQERFRGAATALATATSTRLGCDRVSIGFLRRGRVRVVAVSHSASFGARTNTMRAVAAAMEEAIDQQATIVHPPLADGLALVSRAHAELGWANGAGGACTVVLSEGTRIVGAMTFERSVEQPFDRAAVDLCEALAALGGPALERVRRDDRSLPAKAGSSAVGAASAVVDRQHLGRLAVLAGLVAVGIFLAVARGEFRVSATAGLEPTVRQAVVAAFDGYVAEAPMRAGDHVRAGQTLALLDDREIRLMQAKWLSQQEQLVKQYHQAMATRNAAQVVILSAQIDQAKTEVALLEDQLRRTRIVAPFDGVVVTGDLSQSLASPVQRGQVLFEVAPLDGYRIALQIDERDITYVRPGQSGTLLLTGAPAQKLPFVVAAVTPVSSARDGRNHFRVEARLDGGFDRLRPGMEGVGKIAIDDRRLAWIWTRQVIDWMRLQLWTWLP